MRKTDIDPTIDGLPLTVHTFDRFAADEKSNHSHLSLGGVGFLTFS